MTEQRTSGRNSVLGIIAFVLLAALLLTLAVLSAIKAVRTAESYGSVVRVEDGQTFVVNMDGREQTVALAGVLSPLPAADGRQESLDSCLAEESAENLSGMLEPGESVQLQFAEDANGPDGARAALARSGGQVVNIAQVEAGLAVPVPEQPMERLGTDLREAWETARTEEAGLYSPSVACSLPGRVEPVVDMLRGLPEGSPSTSAEADEQIETVAAAVEQGVTAEKVFATINPEGSTLSSLAWAKEVPRLRNRLDGELAEAQSELASLQSTRKVLLTREREETARREAEEAARRAEEARQREVARQAEIARQQEAARQEAARQEAARQEAARRAEDEARRRAEDEARRRAEDEARRRAEDEARRRAEESAAPSAAPSESSSPSPSSQSPSPSSSRPSAQDEDPDEDDD